jgi:hypothetical protein
VRKPNRRIPWGYDGPNVTTRKFSDILPEVLSRINRAHGERPDLILASWAQVVGPQISNFTTPVSFVDGVLSVRVKNSTLHSLLSQNEKPKILNILRQKFPKVMIKDIRFRLG